MKNSKIDLRIIKTRKNLYEALIILLKEKTFEEMKVSDICEKALINRSTFYAHYNDKYELFASFIEALKEAFTKELNQNHTIRSSKEYYMEMIRIFLDYIEVQKELYSSILVTNQNSIIMDMIYDTLNEDIQKRIGQDPHNEIPSTIVSEFYLGAVFHVGMKWLKSNNQYSKEEIRTYLEKLIPNNI